MRAAGVTPAWPAAALPRAATQAVGIGTVVTLAWFAATWFISFDLSDEGFLWYGAQRTLHGEMPLRDFSAYDIGRYFYTAAVFRLAGSDGILPLRLAAYSTMLPVTAIAAYLATRGHGHTQAAQMLRGLGGACIAILWIAPYFKAFDFLACALLMLAVHHVLRVPKRRAWLLLGAATGIAALIGRNHGLYGVVASLLAYALLRAWPGPDAAQAPASASAFAWLLGAALGYSPMLVALATVDGFLATNLAGLQALLARGETNLGIPVPWPWLVDVRRLGVVTSIAPTVAGLGFVLLLVLPAAAAVLVWRKHSQPLAARAAWTPFLACACVALPYAHYAFSRADMTHLALAMLPAAIGLIAMPRPKPWQQNLQLAVVAAATFAVLAPTSWLGYYANPTLRWETLQVAGTSLRVSPRDAATFRQAEDAITAYLPRGRGFAALPNMPGLHAAHRMPVPMHSIYVLWSTSEAQEHRELQRLQRERPAVILLSDHALDGNDARRFKQLRPLLYAWISAHYTRKPLPDASDRPTTLEVYVLN